MGSFNELEQIADSGIFDVRARIMPKQSTAVKKIIYWVNSMGYNKNLKFLQRKCLNRFVIFGKKIILCKMPKIAALRRLIRQASPLLTFFAC